MHKCSLIYLLFLIAHTVFANVKEYYSLTKSIRALGMGGAFYGLSDDEYALFYNPAGLSLYNQDWQWMFSVPAQLSKGAGLVGETIINASKNATDTATVVKKLSFAQGKPAYLETGILSYYIQKNLALGLLLADTKVNFAYLGKEFDTSLGLTIITDSGLFFGYGGSLACADYVHLGVNAKAVLRAGGTAGFSLLDLANNGKFNPDPANLGGVGAGVDMDLGGIYELRDLPFGLSNRVSFVINNVIGNPLKNFRNGDPPRLTRMATIGGVSVLEGWRFIKNFTVVLDFAEFRMGGEDIPSYGARTGSFWKHVNFGVEMPMLEGWLVSRAGFHQGQWTLGFSLNMRYAKIDAATYAEEVGNSVGRIASRRYAIRIAIGAGAPPPPPLVSMSALKKKTDVSTEEAVDTQAPIDQNNDIKDEPDQKP